jgi:hypothetical protein
MGEEKQKEGKEGGWSNCSVFGGEVGTERPGRAGHGRQPGEASNGWAELIFEQKDFGLARQIGLKLIRAANRNMNCFSN